MLSTLLLLASVLLLMFINTAGKHSLVAYHDISLSESKVRFKIALASCGGPIAITHLYTTCVYKTSLWKLKNTRTSVHIDCWLCFCLFNNCLQYCAYLTLLQSDFQSMLCSFLFVFISSNVYLPLKQPLDFIHVSKKKSSMITELITMCNFC